MGRIDFNVWEVTGRWCFLGESLTMVRSFLPVEVELLRALKS